MKLTDEQKQNRKDMARISKQYDREHGKNKIRRDNGFRIFVIFDNTKVSEGGWLSHKWMTAKFMNRIVDKWVRDSYETRADNYLKTHKNDMAISPLIEKLKEIDNDYDLTAGCAQCGGCRWYAAIDGDYGFCFNQDSPNEGRITFEHGGCIQHSFIQNLLNKE